MAKFKRSRLRLALDGAMIILFVFFGYLALLQFYRSHIAPSTSVSFDPTPIPLPSHLDKVPSFSEENPPRSEPVPPVPVAADRVSEPLPSAPSPVVIHLQRQSHAPGSSFQMYKMQQLRSNIAQYNEYLKSKQTSATLPPTGASSPCGTNSSDSVATQALCGPAKASVGASGDGSTIPLTDYFGLSYVGPVSIGTPAQVLKVVFDTGSTDFWAFSSLTHQRVRWVHYFNGSLSSSYQPLRDPFAIQYGLGRVSGLLARETVQIGSAVARQQTFAEAVEVTDNFFDNPSEAMDGILGMAFQGASTSNAPAVLETLFAQGQVSSKVFSFLLAPAFSTQPSMVILGPPDKYLNVTGGLTYAPVVDGANMWLIRLEEMGVGGNLLPICAHSSTPCVALIDTGTSFLAIAMRHWSTVVSAITANRTDCKVDRNRVECDVTTYGLAGLPTLMFHFASREFFIGPEDYIVPLSGALAIQPIDGDIVGSDLFIMGDTFQHKFLTVFDMQNRRVGFANTNDTVWAPYVISTNDESPIFPTTTGRVMFFIASALGVVGVLYLAFAVIRQCKRAQDPQLPVHPDHVVHEEPEDSRPTQRPTAPAAYMHLLESGDQDSLLTRPHSLSVGNEHEMLNGPDSSRSDHLRPMEGTVEMHSPRSPLSIHTSALAKTLQAVDPLPVETPSKSRSSSRHKSVSRTPSSGPTLPAVGEPSTTAQLATPDIL